MTKHDDHRTGEDLDVVISDEVLDRILRLSIPKEHGAFSGVVANHSSWEIFEQFVRIPSKWNAMNCKSCRFPRVLQLLLIDWNYLPLIVEANPGSVTDGPIQSLDRLAFRI